MATHSNGIAALQLQKQLGLGSYKSAWLLGTKLRRAMVAPDRSPLAGRVEIDETAIRLRRKDAPPTGRGRSAAGKMLVAGAERRHAGGPGRVRLAAIADFSAASLYAFVATHLASAATARTDGWSGYPGVPRVGHDPHVVGTLPALGSYKTAWLLCAKLRQVMVAPHRAPLAGLVEIDETVIPHRTKADPPVGRQGRSANGKMLIAGAIEVHHGRPGRVRLAPIADFSAASLHAFIKANVEAGAATSTRWG